MNWVSLSLKLNRVQCTITTFQNMNTDVFYYSSDQSFPLENILQEWILEVGWHSSYLVKETCQNGADILELYEMIGTNPEDTSVLYYLTKPSEIEHYSQSSFQIGKLVGIKASLSKKHAKKCWHMRDFMKWLGQIHKSPMSCITILNPVK